MKASSDLRSLRNVVVVCAVMLAVTVGIAAVSMGERGGYMVGDAPDSTGKKVPVVTRSILMPGYSLEELAVRSDLIVSGTIASRADSVLIEPSDGGEPLFFTDVSVAVDDVFLDRTSLLTAGADELVVRTEGGEGEYVEMEVEGAPTFDEGSRYLLFLYRLNDGAYYNAVGDHCYVVGVSTGAWEAARDGSFASPCWQSDGRDHVTAADVRAVVSAISAEPRSVSPAGSVPFARVLTGDERHAYEQGVLAAAN